MTVDAAPRLLDARRDREALSRLQDDRGVLVCDTIELQIAELVRCRHPGEGWSDAAVQAEARRIAGPRSESYGTWVHYPWSRRLVHVLPKSEYVELRTSRNRNKITRSEQEALGKLKLGVVGLSVGQATAVTLALEGIGGELRLADHDTLALSNMNRLRAGVHEIGVKKTAIVARAIYELDPYAELVLFDDGIGDDNLAAFLDGLDLLFEECDDLAMKIRLREAARERGLPVLMETSDRGMLDVERFDLERHRPILHGLVGDVDAKSLRGLTTAEKVPFILAMIGEISPRAAASLVDIDATIETWPQLASAVSLGAAVNVDTARRIALGTMRASGRYYVDLDRIIGPLVEPVEDAPVRPRPAVESSDAFVPEPSGVAEVVRWASLAPSGGNCQPWRFVHRSSAGRIECWHARERSESLLDFEDRASYLALGAALENARLACVRSGLEVSIDRLPGPPGLAWSMHLGAGPTPRTKEDDALAGAVEARATNRRGGERRPLPAGLAEALARVAADAGAELLVWTDPSRMAAVGELVARAERLRVLHPALHREMVDELRWSPEEARRSRDGIDVATLALTPTDAAGLHLLRSPAVVRAIRGIGGGEGLKKPTRKAVSAASALCLLRVPAPPDPATYLRGGEALERVWLLATAARVAVQPMTAILFLMARAVEGGPHLDTADRAELMKLREGMDAVAGPRRGAEVMLLRLAITEPPDARALRLPLGSVLSAG